MSSLRRGVEGVCADLGGPFRERKPGVQSRCAASTLSGEGWAKPPPARRRSNRYIRSSPSRRHRPGKAAHPGCSGPWPRPGRQIGPARPGSRERAGRGQARLRCRVLVDGVPGCGALEDGARQARDRYGPWLRPTRIERRSAGSPLQRFARVCRSRSCAFTTIRSEPREQRLKMR